MVRRSNPEYGMSTWLKIVAGLGVVIIGGVILIRRNGGSGNAVLSIAQSVPNGGVYGLGGGGVPFDIIHQGAVILRKGSTVYCSGFTFATAFRAATELGLLASKTVAQVRQFQKDWYGGGSESEQLSGIALELLGIGRRVSHSEAQPGDFVQLWRTNTTGHSVIFLDWLEENGVKTGMKFRAAGGGGGVGNSQERFSDSGGSVIRQRTYFSRLG